MLNFIKKNLFIVIIFFITLLLGFVTFLTFLDKSFIKLNDQNLQYLLLSNIFLLIIFFLFIFLEVKNSIKSEIVVEGSRANRKYIAFFSLFTLIPSILISAFSLFLFSFAVEKYFDKKITTAVDNSYRIAQNYVIDVRNKIESDIVLVAFDLNKNIKIIQNNKKQFASFLNTQKIVRDVDGIFLVDSEGKLILSNFTKKNLYQPPSKEALKMVQNDDRPLKILNAYENTSAALMRLTNYNNTFVYVVKFLDPKISKYLTESKDAISFYYTVQEKRTGIKISFAIIYMIVVTLLLFLSISIAIRFSSRFFVSINNLISASNNIGNGKLMSINADSLSDGTAVYISNQGNGLSGGSLLHLSTNAVGSNNGVVRLDGNEITSGKAAVINTQKLTTGKALEISTNEDLTSGKLLDVSTSSTQAYNPVAISGKRMTTGKIVQINGDNIISGSLLDLSTDGGT